MGSPRLFRGTYRAACWLLVAFYLLAACRAFVPGICATLNAVYAQHDTESCEVLSSGLPSCCASRELPGKAGDRKPGEPPAAPQDGHCPFCTLVVSPVPAPCFVTLPEPAAPLFTPPIPLWEHAPQAYIALAIQNRAPPA